VKPLGNIPFLQDFGTVPIALEFSIDSYPGLMREVGKFRRKSGWLRAIKMTLDSHALYEERFTLACITDNFQTIFPWRASKLLEMRCSMPLEVFDDPPKELDDLTDTLYWDFLGTCDLKHLKLLGEVQEQSDKRAANITRQMDETFILAEDHISKLRKERRLAQTTLERRVDIDQRIQLIRSTQDKAIPFVRKKLDHVEHELEQYEADVDEAIKSHGTVEELYTIHWTARSLFNKRLYSLPFQEVGFTRSDANHKTMHMTECLLPVDKDEDEKPITIPPMPQDGKRLLTVAEKEAFAREEELHKKYATEYMTKPYKKLGKTQIDDLATKEQNLDDSLLETQETVTPNFDSFEKELLAAIEQVEPVNSGVEVVQVAPEIKSEAMDLDALRLQHEKRKLAWDERRKRRQGLDTTDTEDR
jgi:hypothetical protein